MAEVSAFHGVKTLARAYPSCFDSPKEADLTRAGEGSNRTERAVPRPSESSRYVSFVPLPSWIKAAARCGFAIGPVLRDIGVSLDGTGLRGVTLTHAQSGQLIEACVARARGEHFPFVLGECFAFDSLPEIESLLATCPTLRDAIKAHHWVDELMSPALRLVLHEAGDRVQLRINLTRGRAQPAHSIYFTEGWLTYVLKLTRTLLGEQQSMRLLFRHSAPTYLKAYERAFDLEVKFDQPHDALELNRELLGRPLHGAIPELHRQAQVRIKHRVSKVGSPDGRGGQVERAFFHDATLFAKSMVECAAALGLEVRTLQRRLKDEGQSFAELQARSRFRLACALLRDTSLDLEAISERLSFSDRRAFTRAFKRWAGLSPSTFRHSPDAGGEMFRTPN
jgi:AraC-like DNA-binding protein